MLFFRDRSGGGKNRGYTGISRVGAVTWTRQGRMRSIGNVVHEFWDWGGWGFSGERSAFDPAGPVRGGEDSGSLHTVDPNSADDKNPDPGFLLADRLFQTNLSNSQIPHPDWHPRNLETLLIESRDSRSRLSPERPGHFASRPEL